MYKIYRLIVAGLLGIAAVGCHHNNSQETVSLSGTVSAAVDNATDSDVNDPNAPYSDNNSVTRAQTLPNPVTVGGFVALPGKVSVGRFADGVGDPGDFYSMTLLKGQAVTLTIGDRFGNNYSRGIGEPYDANDTINNPGNIIDMFLLDSNQTQVASTENNAAAEVKTLTAPATGFFYVQVKAVTGASDYLLDTGLSACEAGAAALSTLNTRNTLNIGDDFVPGEVIVRFKPASPQVAAYQTAGASAASLGLLAKAGAPGRSMLMTLGDPVQTQQALAALSVAAGPAFADAKTQRKYETLQVIKALQARSDVEDARPNYIRHATVDPDDLNRTTQWNLPLINWPQVWDAYTTSGIGADGSGAIVAVIDTGILPGHPDINAARLVAGFDFISDTSNAADGDGIDSDPTDPGESGIFHGTHVAGIIAAETNNNKGIAGVAWNARIMPLRALGASGGTDYDIEQAVLYAAGLPNDGETAQQTADRVAAGNVADVINLSLGGPTDSTVAPAAYKSARDNGVIIVAAAGNDASCGLSYPASLEGVVSVSAVGSDKVIASYSNFGSTVDIAAPGGSGNTGIYSTWGDNSSGALVYNYAYLQGTSMAAPHVAGVAALMKSANPALSPDIFDSLLVNGNLTEDLGSPGRDNSYGYGLIDAQLAVQSANLDVQALNPLLEITPAKLHFEQGVDRLQFSLTNGGGTSGTLTVTTPNSYTQWPWLSIEPGADVDSAGLGTYAVNIDRALLPQQASAGALLTVTYQTTDAQNNVSNGTREIPVIVYSRSFTADAGYQYILLYDVTAPAGSQAFRTVGVAAAGGRYQYTLDQVPPGTYTITTGSDLNNNDSVSDKADSKGDYPYLGRRAEIAVGSDNIRGLDFSTGYSLLFSNGHEITNKPSARGGGTQ
jgi:serine protease